MADQKEGDLVEDLEKGGKRITMAVKNAGKARMPKSVASSVKPTNKAVAAATTGKKYRSDLEDAANARYTAMKRALKRKDKTFSPKSRRGRN